MLFPRPWVRSRLRPVVLGRHNWHRLATTTSPRSRLKTIQDNIKAEIGHLEYPQHGTHRHQLDWFGGSEVQRFRGSEVQRFDAGAKDGGNHGGMPARGKHRIEMGIAER